MLHRGLAIRNSGAPLSHREFHRFAASPPSGRTKTGRREDRAGAAM